MKIWPLRGHGGHISDLWEVIIQNRCYFWNPWPKKPMFRHPWSKKWHIVNLTSQRSWQSYKRPPRGGNPKLMLFLKSLTQKNLYLDTHQAKNDNLKFWPLRGHGGHISDPREVIIQNRCYFWNPWPTKPMFRHLSSKKWQYEILTSQRSWRS